MIKYFIIFFFSLSCLSQPVINELTSEEFYKIELNGVLKLSIEKTNGDIPLMKDIFGNHLLIEDVGEDIGEFSRYFTYKSGLEVCFSESYSCLEGGNTESTIEVSYINATSIKVLGEELKINDNINKLKGVKLNITKSGGNSIIFTHDNGDCCPIVISINKENRIEKIEYYVRT